MRIIVAGAAGRMGRAVLEAAAAEKDIIVSGAFEKPGHPEIGKPAGTAGITISAGAAELWKSADVLIDFTTPEATLENLAAAAAAGVRAVIGTTGLNAEQTAQLKKEAARLPVCFAPNYSVGVNVLINLCTAAARALGEDYDIEIIEAHHRLKKDAPSGTALRLAEAAAAARGYSLEKDAVYARQGLIGERPTRQIGMQTIRGGDIVGEHTILFAGLGDRLELTHRASGRLTFARGALRAARWLMDKPAGLYDMQDVLGLKKGW